MGFEPRLFHERVLQGSRCTVRIFNRYGQEESAVRSLFIHFFVILDLIPRESYSLYQFSSLTPTAHFTMS